MYISPNIGFKKSFPPPQAAGNIYIEFIIGNTAQRLCGRCAVSRRSVAEFFVRLYRNFAGRLAPVRKQTVCKKFLCKMTENMQADDV